MTAVTEGRLDYNWLNSYCGPDITQSPQQPHEEDIFISILQIRKLRLRETKIPKPLSDRAGMKLKLLKTI